MQVCATEDKNMEVICNHQVVGSNPTGGSDFCLVIYFTGLFYVSALFSCSRNEISDLLISN